MNTALRVLFKIVILLLAMLATVVAGAIFHFRTNDRIAGIVLLGSAFGLFFIFSRILFPSVYRRSWKARRQRP